MIQYSVDPLLKIANPPDLLKERPHVILVNKFSEESAKEFRDNFALAEQTSQSVIPIVIDSYGGQVYALMSMIETIKASKKTVATIVSGKAMSCGALLFSMGHEGYRYMGPLATLMIHDVSSGSFGKIEEIKADAKEGDRLNQLVYKMMAENCGKNESYFLDIVHAKSHADWYLDLKEAKEHNLANKGYLPKFKVNVSVTTKFE